VNFDKKRVYSREIMPKLFRKAVELERHEEGRSFDRRTGKSKEESWGVAPQNAKGIKGGFGNGRLNLEILRFASGGGSAVGTSFLGRLALRRVIRPLMAESSRVH
jgi:hypothetical protein